MALRQLLVNGEPFLLKRHLNRALAGCVDPATRDFNFERFSARDVSAVSAVDRCLTLPMMAESRTVVIEDLEEYGKEDLETLARVLDQSDLPTNLFCVAGKVDKRTAFYKTFAKHGEVIEFKKPYANQVPSLIAQEARVLGLSFEAGASESLVATSGADLGVLAGELEKLRLFAHPETRITRRHVLELASEGAVENVFELANRIGGKKLAEASDLFRRMREQGEPVIKIIALVIGHFRKVYRARDAAASGKSANELPEILGVPPFFAKDYAAQARAFSGDALRRVYSGLMRLSEDIRSTSLDGDVLFENFLKDTCTV